jgi:hypothetical protein
MVYNIRNHWVFGLCPFFGILKDTIENKFRTLQLFSSSSEGEEETPTLLGPLALTNDQTE